MQKVRKAVIPVAGLGTRFLPATKSMPKEMLPVVDRPVVQYAVDEAFEAGIEHIVFVTGRNKAVIEDYFDLHPELIGTLEQTGKKTQLEALESMLPVAGATSFIRQQSPQGLGHAVWCAREVIGDEPFALLLPDMVSFGGRGCLAETMDLYRQTGGNVIAVERCDPSETSKYGIVGRGTEAGSGFEVTAMVEKPAPANAPSNYYINGRYILQPEIFSLLGNQQRGAGNEIQLTDAMVRLSKSQSFYAQPFNGRMFDCGSKEGFIEATIAFALARNDMKGPVLEMLQAFVRSHERQEVAA
ncbi:UTP--glucose-1-phosphate uridylyltransferase GalU [Mesorhizobium sp. WSM4303]|uniref:UTP--glucose-1-phosphate uridylyltransferase GalU n=1 Tax=unclassified Mesorhizobium TaxID=325217 RepID=UPI00115D5F38|nr:MULTISPECIES: UTP--glucose-1-phosphate uridylyltransferase GalU [unclassified Mesorhizobium]TRC95775.1 UTP--glucose-1-phosphate uridylyltransferase GalU [Mesorhizobium sp. WSM4306]TRD04509.1 UTP--glucose-1-phosphate uridylyltransferase GalU [Mesorhizobium sp. WSM4303]